MPIERLMHDFYDRSRFRFRVKGRHCTRDTYGMLRGICQGDPLSVVGFNALMLPIVTVLASYEAVDFICYADDLTLVSTDQRQLQCALDEVVAYLGTLDIEVANKSQYWVTSPAAMQQWKQDWLCDFLRCARRLRPLPMTAQAKQRAWSSIVLARLLYSPWGLYLSAKELHALRNRLVGPCPRR
eukprot:671651-Amphidinium_carterae.3